MADFKRLHAAGEEEVSTGRECPIITTPGENVTAMASSSQVIVDLDETKVDFTELPPERLLCPECSRVFRDPHVSVCCRGRTYCRKCLQKRKEDGPCPECGVGEWEMEADESSQRSVNDLYVRCLHVSDGCLWFGRLEQLPRHIDRSKDNGCVFIKLSCPHNCGQLFARKMLTEHSTKRCPKRPYKIGRAHV